MTQASSPAYGFAIPAAFKLLLDAPLRVTARLVLFLAMLTCVAARLLRRRADNAPALQRLAARITRDTNQKETHAPAGPRDASACAYPARSARTFTRHAVQIAPLPIVALRDMPKWLLMRRQALSARAESTRPLNG